MTTSLVPTNSMPINREAEDAATRSPFTSYVVLLSGMHKAVQDNEPPGSRPGVYLFAKRKLLTDFVALVPKAQFRPRASFTPPNNKPELKKIETRDPFSKEWKEIEGLKKKKIQGARIKLGSEALLWLPDEGEYAIIALQNSARKAAKPLADARDQGYAVKIRSKKESFQDASGSTITYFVPVIESVVLDRMPKQPTQEQTDDAFSQFLAYTQEEPAEDEPATER